MATAVSFFPLSRSLAGGGGGARRKRQKSVVESRSIHCAILGPSR
jgi:hypothetical protein